MSGVPHGKGGRKSQFSDDQIRAIYRELAVKRIAERRAKRFTYAAIAERLGCHKNTVWQIANDGSYGGVSDPYQFRDT